MAKVLHLCNPGAADAAFDGVVPITSMAELDKQRDQDIEAWLVFAHLNWGGNRLSQNYGFDVALRIRTEFQSNAPIIIYSPIRLEYFKRLNGVKYRQLHGPGIAFLITPSTPNKVKKLFAETPALSRTALHDVRTMLCDLRGLVVDQMNHNLRWGKDIKAELDRLSGLLGTADKIKVNFDTTAKALLQAVKEEDREGFERLKEDLYKAFDKLIPRVQDGSIKAEPTNKKKHKVLVLDDDENDLRTAKEALESEFEVIGVRTSEAAIQKLDADKDKNEIRAVVCDWRLYKYDGKLKTEDWQVPHQGYGVLEYAAKSGIRALYALTGQDELLVDQMRNLSGIRYALFKKKHLETPEQWAVMRDVLKEGCLEAIASNGDKIVAGAAPWLVPVKKTGLTKRQTYVEIHNSASKGAFFNEVMAMADAAWVWYMKTRTRTIVKHFDDLGYSSKSNDVEDMKKFFSLRMLYFGLWYDKFPSRAPVEQSEWADHRDSVEKVLWGDQKSKGLKRSQLCIDYLNVGVARMFPEEVTWLRSKQIDPGEFGRMSRP